LVRIDIWSASVGKEFGGGEVKRKKKKTNNGNEFSVTMKIYGVDLHLTAQLCPRNKYWYFGMIVMDLWTIYTMLSLECYERL
jgi:hypothetical protein